jgi:hypothetical protein
LRKAVLACSVFARTATAGRAIAARLAIPKSGAGKDALPTGVSNGVGWGGSIVATVNVRTGDVDEQG